MTATFLSLSAFGQAGATQHSTSQTIPAKARRAPKISPQTVPCQSEIGFDFDASTPDPTATVESETRIVTRSEDKKFFTVAVDPNKDCSKKLKIGVSGEIKQFEISSPSWPVPKDLPCQSSLKFPLGHYAKRPSITAALYEGANQIAQLQPGIENSMLTLAINTSNQCGKTLKVTLNGEDRIFTILPRASGGQREVNIESRDGKGTSAELISAEVRKWFWTLTSMLSGALVLILAGGFLLWKFPSQSRDLHFPVYDPRAPIQQAPIVQGNGPRGDQIAFLRQELAAFRSEMSEELHRGIASVEGLLAGLKISQTARQDEVSQTSVSVSEQSEPRKSPRAAVGEKTRIKAAQQEDNYQDPFERRYLAMASNGRNAKIPGVTKQVVVNFRNLDNVSKNPGALEPLVPNSSGLLTVFFDPTLAPGQAYLAPSLEFEGSKWTSTHTKNWGGYFDFTSDIALKLERAAIVELQNDEFVLYQRGLFV